MRILISGTPWDLTASPDDFIGSFPVYDYEADTATGFLCVMD